MNEKRNNVELIIADSIKIEAMIFVNKQKRIVVAVAKGMENLAIFALSKFLSCSEEELDMMPSVSDALQDKLLLNKTYRGYAVCVPEDTWDEQIGIDLATARLRRKLEFAVHDRLQHVVDEAYKMYNLLDELHDKYQDAGFQEKVDLD